MKKASTLNTEHLQVMASKKLKAAIVKRVKDRGLTISEYLRGLAVKDLESTNAPE